MTHRWEYGDGRGATGQKVQLKEQWAVGKTLAAQEAKAEPESQRRTGEHRAMLVPQG